ncbi:MAG TPA: hypothetical protein VEG38_05840 [Acidimicrobiia bacterium]|nr:hypothetical protein [Acidimicrobiia bacterium]
MRRHALFVTAPACAVLAFAPVAAKADFTPAPPSSASGVAAQVGSIVDISKTDAAASKTSGEARASVLRVGGQPLLGLGGEQKGDGETGGALVDTGEALPARVELAPWKAAAATNGGTRTSKAAAAVAKARIEKVLNLKVLSSESEAAHTDEKSTGTAISDGVDLELLDAIRVVLLHSEVRSEGEGSSYLVGLNDTKIGTGEQLGQICALAVPSVANLSCLTAKGGNAGPVTNAAANVATVTPELAVISALNPVAAFTAAASSGAGQAVADAAPAAAPVVTAPAEAVRAADAAPAAAAAAPAAGLPRTGAALAGLAVSAVTALVLGAGLRRFGRRPVRS